MNLPEFLALLVVFVATPMAWLVVIFLWGLSRSSPALRFLRAATVSALAWALLSSVFAFVFVQNGLDDPPLDNFATQVLTRTTVLVLTVGKCLYWLRLYWRGRHRDD